MFQKEVVLLQPPDKLTSILYFHVVADDFGFVGHGRHEAKVPQRGRTCPCMAGVQVPPRAEPPHLQTSKGSHVAKIAKAQLLQKSWEA